MTATRAPYYTAPNVAVCPRCNGAYGSLLHELCEFEVQLSEVRQGWRHRITCAKPLTPPRNTPASNVVVGVPKLVTR